MLARVVPRLAGRARVPMARAVPALTRLATTPLPAARPLTTTAALAKKKKGGADKGAEPPADVEGQLDLNAIGDQMAKTVAKCAESVQATVGSLGPLLDPVRVSYGKDTKATPLHDYATVGVRDNLLIITAYEEGHIEKGIYAAKLDLSPRIAPEEGECVIVVPVPKPTGETRQLLVQKCVQASEQAKVALRSARQTAQKQLKADLDNKVVSKTVMQKESKKLEDLTKAHTAAVERLASDAQKRLQK